MKSTKKLDKPTIIKKYFKSTLSRDSILLSHPKNFYKQSHKARFNIVMYDNYDENIKLITEIIEYANNNNIKWISLKVNGRYIVPQNGVLFKNEKKDGVICCHIEDFVRFYMKNMDKIISLKSIYATKSKTKDTGGWVTVKKKTTAANDKYNMIKKKVKELNDDWSLL